MTTVRSFRKIRPRRRVKIGGTRSVISRISSFKPKSLITVGGKRRYRKHSGGSRKSYRKVKSGGKSKKSHKKTYKKVKSGGKSRRRTKRSKSKRT